MQQTEHLATRKKTIFNWEKKLSRLQERLFLYALVNEFVKLVIEGDELYTKVRKNEEASASEVGQSS